MDDYRTTDLGLASFLMALGFACKIEDVPGVPGQCAFVFDGAARKRVDDFYAGEKVEAYKLLLCERELKGRLYHARPVGKMKN